MNKPQKMDTWHRPPALTPEYLAALRRRWAARSASLVTVALKESVL